MRSHCPFFATLLLTAVAALTPAITGPARAQAALQATLADSTKPDSAKTVAASDTAKPPLPADSAAVHLAAGDSVQPDSAVPLPGVAIQTAGFTGVSDSVGNAVSGLPFTAGQPFMIDRTPRRRSPSTDLPARSAGRVWRRFRSTPIAARSALSARQTLSR